ncbi:hypothetical protein PIB30_077567 [Stylosanthes scabra]|uniref:Uncharacterized protein n=1 Tax=Stylosanthes scabra TaxID=79078 RepID=A0ABU6QSW9_9FABA|nr:hypothetical protein [Stylosanthes scabra]
MPIYHDYHGDSRSSSISIWDQIQISLISLLPSYEPILCDSPAVSSFLSDQKQPQICPEFQQSCDIQEEEIYTDSINEDLAESVSKSNQQTQQEENNAILNQILEIHHFQIHINNSISRNSNIQCSKQTNPELETSDPEIQVLTQSDTEPKSSAGNFKFNQNSISVSITATPTEASDYSGFPEITNKSDAEVTIVPCGGANRWIEGDRQWSESVMVIGGCLRLAHNEGGEEKLRVSPLEMTEEAEAIRPPPAPPDLYSFEVGDDNPPDLKSIPVVDDEPTSAVVTAAPRSWRPEDLTDAETRIQRRRPRRLREGKTNDGDVAKPPPLLAAVLPSNRSGDDEERSRDRWQRQAVASTRGDGRNLSDLLSGTAPTGSWWYGAVQTIARRREGATVVESGSLFGFGIGVYSRKDRKWLLLVGRGGRCVPGMAVVELARCSTRMEKVKEGWRWSLSSAPV